MHLKLEKTPTSPMFNLNKLKAFLFIFSSICVHDIFSHDGDCYTFWSLQLRETVDGEHRPDSSPSLQAGGSPPISLRKRGGSCLQVLSWLEKIKFKSISDTCDKTSESLETGFLFSVSSPRNEFSPISLNVYIETECTSVPKTAAKLQSLSRYVCC